MPVIAVVFHTEQPRIFHIGIGQHIAGCWSHKNGKEVDFMQEGKTIGQLMEEMRQKAGAQNYHGHDYMDLQRFAENTRHMIIFDVLTHDSPVGWKGERTRLFLSDIGYEKALDSQANGQIKILSHAKVRNGDLFYDHKEQIR